jgi:hypothetical protein
MSAMSAANTASAPPAPPLPSSWDTSKRKSTNTTRTAKRARRSTAEDHNTKTVQAAIAGHIPNARDRFESTVCLQLDDILARSPFEQQIRDTTVHTEAPAVVEITRAYEEQYLRESLPGEDACAMGPDCECMHIDRAQPFIGVRFVIPDVRADDNNMCLLCLRKATSILFYRIVLQGIQSSAIIQRYGNICGRDGEYHPSAMLICPPAGPVHCMPLPVVAHQRNRYSVIDQHGVKYLRQHGVGMQDFREPPPPLSV